MKKVYNIIVTEAYRSGHNGTDSKSVVPHGTVGSNPTVSAKAVRTAKENCKGNFAALFIIAKKELIYEP